MNKNPFTYDELVSRARTHPRLVSENEVRAMMARTEQGEPASSSARAARTSGRGRGAGLAAVALGVAVLTYQGLDARRPMPEDISTDPRYQVFVLRDSVSGDSTVITVPVAEEAAQSTSDLQNEKWIPGVRAIELTADELARIGVRSNTEGVWVYYEDDHGKVQGMGVTTKGSSFETRPTAAELRGLTIMSFMPTVITDDLGRVRILTYEDEKVDSALARRIAQLPEGSSERLQLTLEMSNKADRHTVGRMSILVPIIAHTGGRYSAEDSAANRWRPDAILWYEPTPELLAALPPHVRARLVAELEPAPATRAPERRLTAPSERRLTAPSERRPEARKPRIDNVHATAAEPSTSRLADRASDTIAVVREVPVRSEDAVTGHAYLELSRGTSGAITESQIFPNPTREKAMILYRLSMPRHITVTLHDITGRPIRESMNVELKSAGSFGYDLPIQGLPSGIYLVAITTDHGEQAVQRLVIDR